MKGVHKNCFVCGKNREDGLKLKFRFIKERFCIRVDNRMLSRAEGYFRK